jgi:hypothetical protein
MSPRELVRLSKSLEGKSTHVVGPNLAKTKFLAKDSTVNQVDRLHGGAKPAHAVRE